MRRRTIQTTQILALAAVAVGVTTGCGNRASTVPAASAASVSNTATPTVVVVDEADTTADQATAPATPPVNNDVSLVSATLPAEQPADDAVAAGTPKDDPALHPLREELRTENRDQAFARIEHFRALCDKDGYPLVGNVFRKEAGGRYQASEFCSDVRARKSPAQ